MEILHLPNLDNLGWDGDDGDLLLRDRLVNLIDWSKLPQNHFIRTIEDARSGSNVGFFSGVSNLDKYTYGVHRGRYYLLGADSGVGKTTVADFIFLFNLYQSARQENRKLHIFYYSFEISMEEKKARWCSYIIYRLYNVMLPSDYIQGRIRGMMISEEHMEMVRVAYLYIEDMMKYTNMVVVEDPVHPTKIFHDLIDYHFDRIGKVHREKAIDEKKRGRITGWTPNPGEESSVTVAFIDHVALLMPEQGFDTKQTIDLLSRYMVSLRNLFSLTSVVIQQFNTELTSMYRDIKAKAKDNDSHVAPQRMDFGDSRYTFRDANIVLGLFKPSIYDITTYYGYDIKKLGTNFVGIHLMKNRHGAAQRMLPVFLNGITGEAQDLPLTPKSDIAMEAYYSLATKLENVTRSFHPQ